jgi:putative toxin-antitoxin system antitoxin component (TIGR02293 family)
MSMPAERVEEILGLKPTTRGMAGLAAAIEKGLPRSALMRVVARAGVTGKARLALLHRVVPSATFKRRTRLKLHESEKTERLARVIALSELLWDDAEAAQRFISAPHPELQNRSPLDCAGTELGARQVEDVVMRAIYGLPV